MRLVVDTNLVFSAILNANSNIGDIILNSNNLFQFYSCHYLWYEIKKHRDKLLRITKISYEQLIEIEQLIYNEIHFIDEEQIPKKFFKLSNHLVQDIDKKDIPFIALNEYLKAKLWTGDIKLINGLREKKYLKVITTNELMNLRDKMH